MCWFHFSSPLSFPGRKSLTWSNVDHKRPTTWPTTSRLSLSPKSRIMNVTERWTVNTLQPFPPPRRKKRGNREMPSATASRRTGRSVSVRSPRSTASSCNQIRRLPSRPTSPQRRRQQKLMGPTAAPRSMDLVSHVQLTGLEPLLTEVPRSQTAP